MPLTKADYLYIRQQLAPEVLAYVGRMATGSLKPNEVARFKYLTGLCARIDAAAKAAPEATPDSIENAA